MFLSLAFTLNRYSLRALQIQNCSSFLAGTKLYLIADTKLHRITLSSVNAWLIRSTFVSDHKVIFLGGGLCWGNAMVAYTKPPQRKKEESKRLRGERDQIKFIDLGFER